MSTLAHEKQILEYEKTIAKLKEQNKDNALWSDDEIAKFETKLEQLQKQSLFRTYALGEGGDLPPSPTS